MPHASPRPHDPARAPGPPHQPLPRAAPERRDAMPREAALKARCDIARAMASAWTAVSLEAIRHPNRLKAPICEARHVAMYLANTSLQVSLTAMAAEFGRDRTSCAHAVRRIEDRRDDPVFDAWLARLELLAAVLDEVLPQPAGAARRGGGGQ